MQFGRNYDIVDDEVEDEAQRIQIKIHIDQQKTHRKIHKMIKIQKMSFRTTLNIAKVKAKNPVIHV